MKKFGLYQGIEILLVVCWVVSLFPFTMLWLLYLISFRATYLLGYWPIVGRDDPFNISHTDKIYQILIWLNNNDLVLVLPLAIFAHLLMRSFKWMVVLKIQLFVFIFGIILLIGEPTRRLEWWID